MDNIKRSLKVALHGMDERSVRTMAMYLKGPCQGVAVVVDAPSAEIDIFDGDSITSKKLLTEYLAKSSVKPVIVLSLQNVYLDNVVSVKKPVKAEDMMGALAEVKARLELAARQEIKLSPVVSEPLINKEIVVKPTLKTYVINQDEQQTTKHQTAMQMNDAALNAYIGNVPGVDVNDPAQFAMAGYNPKDYFQGYMQSAINACQEKKEIMQLHSGWRPLILFPENHEIWLDADDKQLRAFASLKLDNPSGNKMSLSPINAPLPELINTPEKLHNMDAFIWKLACWTSKGRYPDSINIEQPVYLKNWPNFTRLLITPHAMRIAALLVREPRTLGDVARILNIKPQYVFVFISAACAVGLAGQARRAADVLVEPADIKPSQKQGLLGRIISKLRGSYA